MQHTQRHMLPYQQQPPRALKPAPKSALRSPYVIAAGLLTSGSVIVLIMVGIAALMLYGPTDSTPGAAPEPDIAPGVTVAGIPLGGESVTSAMQLIQARNLPSEPVTLTDNDREWTLSLSQIGVSVDTELTAQLASDAAANTAVQPWYTINLSTTQQALIDLSDQVNRDATTEEAGRVMQIPELLNRLYQNLNGEIADGRLELAMVDVDPTVSDAVVDYNGETSVHVVEQGEELALIARLYGVDMADIIALNNISNPNLLYIGQELTIPAAGVYTPADVPAPPTTTGKAIVVSTQQQRIFAYENGEMIHSYLTSTGLPKTPTVKGDYKVYVKHEKTDMSGPDYFLPDVPYTMYFYQGYGIHGTYWHNSFGRPMSHGCVNLPTEQAQWFFNWAEVGTPVRVV